MNSIFKKLISLTLVASFAFAVITPAPVSAACSDRLLTFPAWYRGLVDGECNVKSPKDTAGGIGGFVWKIALNLIEAALQVVGYLAAVYLLIGGYKYITSTGTADGMAGAKKTIQNAVIGLLISIFSIAIVNVVAGAL